MISNTGRRTSRRHSSALASLVLVLTLGVGTGEAWHGDEHGDQKHCTECALCHITADGPVTRGIEAPETRQHDVEGKLPAQGTTALAARTSRRADPPRAPPA